MGVFIMSSNYGEFDDSKDVLNTNETEISTKKGEKRIKVDYKFKFSIIMSVYQVEEFIDEAVARLLKQTLNFKNNLQVIMVDDGSTDGSGAICDKYAKMYPNNFVVIHKENGGLSSARNEGLRHVE
jgi:cellulose synthase/poly-beta-1,6-N-acetylglucosamine synthase-like glycosyltransferase